MLVEAVGAATSLLAVPGGAVYHVRRKFLQATQRSRENEIVITRPENGPPRAVAIILGWGGATLRQLNKTTQWYAKQGVTTVTYTAPMKEVIMGVVEMDPLHALCDTVAREMEQTAGSPLQLHLFSNNGALTFGGLLHLWETQHAHRSLRTALQGVVWDSAPCLTDYVLDAAPYAAPVTGLILNRPRYKHWLYTPTMHYLLPAMRRATAMPANAISTEASRELLCSLAMPEVPYLFLYSDNDKLILNTDVEHYAQEQQQQGRVLHKHMFVGSHHVAHFRTFPTEYTQLLSSFWRLDRATNTTNQQQPMAEAAM